MLVSTGGDFTGLDPLGDLAGGEPSTQTMLGRQLQNHNSAGDMVTFRLAEEAPISNLLGR